MNQDIKNLEWLEVFLSYKCNVKCVFCYQKDLWSLYPKYFKKEQIEKILLGWYKDWKRYVIFSWWEPTLDSNLSYYISFAKKIGYIYIRVHTNGFWFRNYFYLEDLYNRGLSWVTISIHWYMDVHNNVTGVPNSFSIINKALSNFTKIQKKYKNFILDTNTVIYQWNYDKLLKLFLYLFKFNINRSQINYISSLDYFNIQEKSILLVEYKLIKENLQKLLVLSIKYNKKIVIDSIPYCIIWENFKSFIDDNIKNDRESFSLDSHNYTYDETYKNYKPDICNKCSYFDKCRWIPEDYYQLYKDIDLTPI